MAKGAQDGFQRYFAEKLWELIPAEYRYQDELAHPPGVLRALVEIWAEQAAILRRSHDRLWEDQFIELCQDWAVPYLGDLVATRLVSALNERARRVDVAKTIYYRRRKGTLRVLEELVSDVTGWEGKVVEQFRRLARTRHGLDPHPGPLAGRFSGTLPGGVADLRQTRAAKLTDGPFDEFFHTADVRQHSGINGRYNIPKLAFHLYRLRAFRVEGVTPFALDDLRFTCDPSGRDIPLHMRRQRPERWDDAPYAFTPAGRELQLPTPVEVPETWDDWRSAKEWELPAPMPCRLLGHAEYVIKESLVRELENNFWVPTAAADKLRRLRGFRFPSEARLREILSLLNEPSLMATAALKEILTTALVTDCGKAALIPDSISVEEAPNTPLERAEISAGDLSQWPIADPKKRLVIDPERGRLQFFNRPPPAGITVTYHYGFAGNIGAGTYGRPEVETREPDRPPLQGGGEIDASDLLNEGVTQIEDNATYGSLPNKRKVKKLTLQAANQQRPYVRLASNWVLRTPADADAGLLIDGIWLGSEGDFDVILRGDYERVCICHCTFDPGGSNDVKGNPIRPVPLFIEAQIETLVISRCIMSRIATQKGGVVENLVVQDSILDATGPSQVAVELSLGEVTLNRVTVFGQVNVNRLWASEALIVGVVDVTDTQGGCFRFSAAPHGSRLPRPYESYTLTDAAHIFTSRRFGHPGYGQLSSTAPPELQRGAENGSEIGAFGSLQNPIKLDGLRAKIDEYVPFGLIPIFIEET